MGGRRPSVKPENLPEAVSAEERIEAQLVTACGALGALLDERQSALDGVEARWSTRIQLQEDAKTAIEDYTAGNRTDVEGVISATKQAETAFKMFLQVRNKVMDAIEEVKQINV